MLPWYKIDTKGRKAIMLMIQRAQREVNISVPFFSVSLPTFANVSCTSLKKNHVYIT